MRDRWRAAILFQQYMAEGDIESVLDVYDPEVVFLNQAGEVIITGREGLRYELSPMTAMKARFEFTIKQIVQASDIALMHTQWTVSEPRPMSAYAIEVARRQPDGTWRWFIGDPFTVGKQVPFIAKRIHGQAASRDLSMSIFRS